MVAAAVIGGVVSAAGSMYAGHKASQDTAKASQAAIAEQQAALDQQAKMTQPYRDFGSSAIPTLQSLLGIAPQAMTSAAVPGSPGAPGAPGAPSTAVPQATGLGAAVPGGGNAAGPGASIAGGLDPRLTATGNVDPRLAALQNTPGYQFVQQQANDAAVNKATAMGLGMSGNTLKALSDYNAGLASTTYQQNVDNLMRATTIGEQAAAGQSANIGQTASNVSNIISNQGQTQAGIDANEVKGVTGAFTNTLNTLGGLQKPDAVNTPTQGVQSPVASFDPYATLNQPGTMGTTTNFENPEYGGGTTTLFQ